MFTYFTWIHTYLEPKSQCLTNSHTALVGIVNRMRTGCPRNRDLIPVRSKSDFSSPTVWVQLQGPTQRSSQWVSDVLSQGTSGQGEKLAASSSTGVKNAWIYNSISPHAFMSCIGTTVPAHAVHVCTHTLHEVCLLLTYLLHGAESLLRS
jgi:hypothetical protein